ncbi:alanyl-tRNA editing protein AlaXM [Stygiolobus caldivivus]|uniref:Alanyl-tRNA editing protein AlaX n=1 Tax=Stygiolobus caldivivus TaxID=2824673 RepID=A0A8D5ZIM7_9CREN|nr:alanyl-tRNA editing protein AlaXM [Stygiolobus caldivivus]BCU70754.1 alanyl-tRNA editing protein AlaX [Stygiolobus caldivivus]
MSEIFPPSSPLNKKLYLFDSYIREFDATVVDITQEGIVLDRTAFYPGGGGLEPDKGFIQINGNKYEILEVKEINGEIYHKLSDYQFFKTNVKIKGEIDWARRYRMMRLHTASHIIASIAYTKYGAKITGGNISPDYAKDDFPIESKEILQKIVEEANEIAKQSIPVKVYFLRRDEALKIPGVVKLAERMPPDLEVWRIVEIEGIDIQADGGPHVKNTSEIGEISLLKVENKGKNRKRIYYTVKP